MPQKKITAKGNVRWVERYRDHAGKERSKSFDTKREAVAWKAEQERALRRGEWVDPGVYTLTVSELMQDWIGSTTRREQTVTKYESTVKNLGELGDLPAKVVTRTDVTHWHQSLTGVRANGRRALSESSARSMLTHLRTAYAWAIEQDAPLKNPVIVPKLEESQAVLPEDIPTAEHIRLVVECVREGGAEYLPAPGKVTRRAVFVQGPNPAVADMLEAAVLTGLRVSELTGLTVGDIDQVGGVVKVRKQLGTDGRSRVALKSKRSRRDVPIVEDLAPMLQVLTIGKRPEEFLFQQEHGAPWVGSRLSVIVKRARDHVGAPTVHFHALRHYFASSLLGAGVPVHEVAALLGHSPSMLLSTYAHVLPGSTERARLAIASSISCGIFAGSEGVSPRRVSRSGR